MASSPSRCSRKFFKQLHNALLLFQGTKEFTHPLARQMQIQTNQIFDAIKMHFRRQAKIQQSRWYRAS